MSTRKVTSLTFICSLSATPFKKPAMKLGSDTPSFPSPSSSSSSLSDVDDWWRYCDCDEIAA